MKGPRQGPANTTNSLGSIMYRKICARESAKGWEPQKRWMFQGIESAVGLIDIVSNMSQDTTLSQTHETVSASVR